MLGARYLNQIMPLADAIYLAIRDLYLVSAEPLLSLYRRCLRGNAHVDLHGAARANGIERSPMNECENEKR